MKPLITIFILNVCLFLGQKALKADSPDTSELKRMVALKSDAVTVRQALELARSTNNEEVLLAALANPGRDIQSEAISAIASLPIDKAKPTLLLALRTPSLWTNHVPEGGEAWIAQNAFLASMRLAVMKVFNTNTDTVDFFDDDQRKNLISQIQLK